MTISLPDLAGILGVSFIIGTYFLLQLRKVKSTAFLYSLLNALGALLIIVSLLYDFNLSAFIVEVFWMGISIYGLIRHYRERQSAG